MSPTTVLPNVYELGYRAGVVLSSFAQVCNDSLWGRLPSQQVIFHTVASFPALYKEWWWNLLQNDPVHVFVETTLIAAILYFLVTRRSKDWRNNLEKLSDKEEAELLQEWKRHGRKPLTPPVGIGLVPINEHSPMPSSANGGTTNASGAAANSIVVHKSNGRFMDIEVDGNEQIHTVRNFATFDFLGMGADTIMEDDNNKVGGAKATITPKLNKSNKKKGQNKAKSPAATSLSSSHVVASTVPKLHPVKQASLEALDRYGCGSCGPRGFYGTIDVHLYLEKAIAEFCGTDDAILYSDGASAVSSTIAAFCKRGDLIVVDEAVYEPIRTGVLLSRANVKWFKHNDMSDLHRVLMEVQKADKSIGRPLNAQRRFLVVEGLYKNTGEICPLDELVKLKHEFKYRLILDESFSFGTIGPTGRGCVEQYNLKLMYDAEIVIVSLENALGSIGALTIGTEEVVDHQRLSGSGYCFSASSPPFTATAALAALKLLRERPEVTLHRLESNRAYLHQHLQTMLHQKLEDLLLITSDARSSIVVLQVAEIPETEYLDEVVFLEEVVRESLLRGAAFVATGSSQPRATDSLPGIRMTVSAAQTTEDIDIALDVLLQAVTAVMGRFHEEEEEM